MKKFLLLTLSLVCIFSLTGCIDTEEEKTKEEDKPQKDVMSGLWEGDYNNKTKKIYFDCEGKYDYSFSVTVSGKTSYYGYSGRYTVEGNNITLYTTNKTTGAEMVAEEFHFFKDSKDTICTDNICYDKSTTDYSCTTLASHTK